MQNLETIRIYFVGISTNCTINMMFNNISSIIYWYLNRTSPIKGKYGVERAIGKFCFSCFPQLKLSIFSHLYVHMLLASNGQDK